MSPEKRSSLLLLTALTVIAPPSSHAATFSQVPNGVCGSANGVPASSAPTTNLCFNGAASSVSGSGPWSWSCAGANGGATAQCSAPAATLVNGVCGSVAGACSSGAAVNIVTTSGSVTWTCQGSGGGSSSTCLAGASSLTPPAGYTSNQLIFDETFPGATLNARNWNPWLGNDLYGRWDDLGRLPFPYSGMNQPGAFQTEYNDPYPAASSVNISGQHLVTGGGLRAIAAPNNHFSSLGYSWASSAVSSYGKFYLPGTGGYVQIRAKMPDSRHGAWAGLWLLSKGGAAGEMDLQESGYTIDTTGKTPSPNYQLASAWHGAGGNQIVQNSGVDLSAAFHTYGLEYKPGGWWKVYLDGQLMASWINGVNGVVVPKDAYELVLDLEIANPAGVSPSVAGWHTLSDPVNYPGPYELDVQEVRIYRLP
jgi:hypothetical protein